MKGDFFKRVLVPALIPLGAFAFIGALVFGFSKILLAVPKDGSVVLGVLMAGCILFAGFAIARGGTIKPAQRTLLIAFSVLLLGGGVATALSIGTRPVPKHLEVADTITSQNTKFDKTQIKLPANEAFILEFNNKDALLHNVAIYDKDPATATAQSPARAFLQPPLVTGPRLVPIEEKEGIPAGVWFFRCDAHVQMRGQALVGGATPSPGASPAASPGAGASPSPAVSPSPGATGATPSPSPSPTVTGGIVIALGASRRRSSMI